MTINDAMMAAKSPETVILNGVPGFKILRPEVGEALVAEIDRLHNAWQIAAADADQLRDLLRRYGRPQADCDDGACDCILWKNVEALKEKPGG